MGYPQVQADHPGPSWLVGRRLRRGHAVDAGEVAGAPAAQEGRPQQPGPDHHPSPGWRSQARLPRHRLPSLRQGRRAGQGRAHRVRPEPHRAHRAAALRRRREALHHRAAGPAPGRADRGRRQAPTSSPATTCRCATSRSVRRSTASSSVRVAAPRSPAPPATRPSWSPRRAAARSCGCPPARCATSTSAAAPRSARSATPSSRTSTGARPAGCAGRASARPSAVSS